MLKIFWDFWKKSPREILFAKKQRYSVENTRNRLVYIDLKTMNLKVCHKRTPNCTHKIFVDLGITSI